MNNWIMPFIIKYELTTACLMLTMCLLYSFGWLVIGQLAWNNTVGKKFKTLRLGRCFDPWNTALPEGLDLISELPLKSWPYSRGQLPHILPVNLPANCAVFSRFLPFEHLTVTLVKCMLPQVELWWYQRIGLSLSPALWLVDTCIPLPQKV